MRKSVICTGVLGIALLAGGAGAASTQQGQAAMDRLAQRPLARLLLRRIQRAKTLGSELNLTDTQRQAIRDTLKSDKSEITQAVEPVVKARQTLRDAVMNGTADDAAIRKLGDDLGKKIGDAAVVLAKVRADVIIDAKLTPDQIQKLKDFRDANDKEAGQLFQKLDQQQ